MTRLPVVFRDGNALRMLRPPGAEPFPGLIGTFMGRDAFRLAGSVLDLQPTDAVLLPAYLCREVLKPFLARCRVFFYDILPDLSVDPEVIRGLVRRHSVRMVLVINYFGFLQPWRSEIRQVCSEGGAVLLEDCAHSLLTEGSGDTGDLVVYSFRKLLGVPDGGGLEVNLGAAKGRAAFKPPLHSNILSLLGMFKSMVAARSDFLSRSGLAARTSALRPAPSSSASNGQPAPILPLSTFSRRGTANAPFADIIQKRRDDYRFWEEQLSGYHHCRPVFPSLPAGVCPLGFPVTTDQRDLIKSRLDAENTFLKVHWHLPDAIGPEFSRSHALSRRTFTLPVYPELAPGERERILRVLAASRTASRPSATLVTS